MTENFSIILLHWGITTMALWMASHIFRGIRFDGIGSLLVSAALLGLANAIVKPLLIILTLPLTVLTLGGFLLVINALVLGLVARLVRGFTCSGFWTAFFASLFIGLVSMVVESLSATQAPGMPIPMPHSGIWL